MAKSSTKVPAKASGGAKLPAKRYDWKGMSGRGLDQVGAHDILTSQIGIIQPLSPQLQKSKPEFIKGAKAGMYVDKATKKIYETIEFVPCYYATKFIEWKPNRGGFAHDWGTDRGVMNKTRRKGEDDYRDYLQNGNYVAETKTFWGYNIEDEPIASFFPLAYTQVKPAKDLISALRRQMGTDENGEKFPAPIFYKSVILKTAERSNEKGEWFVMDWEWGRELESEIKDNSLIDACIAFEEAARSGMIQTAFTQDEGEGAGSDPDGAM
jgi:hypothetical protein